MPQGANTTEAGRDDTAQMKQGADVHAMYKQPTSPTLAVKRVMKEETKEKLRKILSYGRKRWEATREYTTWAAMKQRCQNEKNQEYRRYGARGIVVCERWQIFENFFKDMGKKPRGKSLDRIDNDGPYCKENCRWATNKQQQANRGNLRRLTYKGKTRHIAAWARILKIRPGILYEKTKKMSLDEAIREIKTKGYTFEVIVGNIGSVYGGSNILAARSKFASYVKAGKEDVVLFHYGKIERESR